MADIVVTLKDPVTGDRLIPQAATTDATTFGGKTVDEFAASDHTHTAEDIDAIPALEKGAANGVATLNSDGKVPTEQLPETNSSAGTFPTGGIIFWSGASDAIPDGWALCNGENGTPDLRDKFVIGAGNTYSVGATGGETAHVLTTNEMPSHTHTIYGTVIDTTNGSTVWALNPTDLDNSIRTEVSGYIAATGGSQAHNNLPPYYALCYIMKL